MNSIFRLTFTGILVGLVVSSCAHRISQPKTTAAIPGPHCIVYKTRADYSKLVPVILSADKSKIVSYPDVKDINNNGNFPYPSPLKKGYLLDNRGIGPDVAFIRLTYEEFARLKATPPAADLYGMIADKDPLTVMYDCGNKSLFRDPVDSLNKMITSGSLARQHRLK